jgi:hypothetical protein
VGHCRAPSACPALGRHLTHLLPVVTIIHTANLLAAESALPLQWAQPDGRSTG